MKGDEDAFDLWQASHTKEWDNFISWFDKNQIEITTKNEFLRLKA